MANFEAFHWNFSSSINYQIVICDLLCFELEIKNSKFELPNRHLTKYAVKDGEVEKKEPPETMAVHFLRSCEKGELKIVQGILKNDKSMLQDINIKDLNDASVFQSALNARNDHNKNGFLLACSNGHCDIVEEFLKSGIAKDIITAQDMFKQTGLHSASLKCYHKIVESLLTYFGENQISISTLNDLGRTAYGLAKTENHEAVTEIFER